MESENKLSTRLYDKRDDFYFHIVNFSFLSSNISSGPSYGAYILQLARYVGCCSHYDGFRYCQKWLADGLLSQGYIALRRVFPRRLAHGGFLTIGYCLRTIGYCFPYSFLEIFVGDKTLMEGNKVVMGDPPVRKTL